jgi:hypothetical protein
MRKRTPPINQESYAALNFPDGFLSLGGGKSMLSYQKHLPELIDFAAYLWALLSEATYVYIRPYGGITRRSSSYKILDPPVHLAELSSTTLMACLVGRNELFISHAPETLKHPTRVRTSDGIVKGWKSSAEPNRKRVKSFVQVVPFYIDDVTGEVFDNVALAYRDHVRAQGYRCVLYRTGTSGLAAFVDASWMSYELALALSEDLCSVSNNINPGLNSLKTLCPFMLSPTFFQGLNRFYDESEGDLLVLEALVAEDSTPLLDIPIVSETILPEARKTERETITDWIVDREFRDYLSGLVDGDEVLLKLLGHYIYSSFRDGDYVVLDTLTMHAILGKKDAKRNAISGNLARLNSLVPLEILPHSRAGKATSFKLKSIPDRIMDEMNLILPVRDPVHLSTGGRADETLLELDRGRKDLCLASTSNYPNPVSTRLLNYLNDLPLNSFSSRTKSNMREMIGVAIGFEDEAKKAALASLRQISFHPRPLYKRAENTTRIYALGGHYQTINKGIRKIAFGDCVKLDLSHCQLSIASSLFGAERMQDLLGSGNVWEKLTNSTGLSKDTLKTALYKTLYMHSLSLDPLNNTTGIPSEVVNLMLKNSEIGSFYKARERYIKSNFNGTKTDAFGNELKGDWWSKLGALVQGYEMLLLEPGIDYFLNIKNNKTKIVLWLHDGFYLSGSKRELTGISNKLCKIVKTRAESLGILTILVKE